MGVKNPIIMLILAACDPVSGPWPTYGDTGVEGSMPEPASPDSPCGKIAAQYNAEPGQQAPYVVYSLPIPSDTLSPDVWTSPVPNSAAEWIWNDFDESGYWSVYDAASMQPTYTQRVIRGDGLQNGVALRISLPLSSPELDVVDFVVDHHGILVSWVETLPDSDPWARIWTPDPSAPAANSHYSYTYSLSVPTTDYSLLYAPVSIPQSLIHEGWIDLVWETGTAMHGRRVNESSALGQGQDHLEYDKLLAGHRHIDGTVPVGGFCALFEPEYAP